VFQEQILSQRTVAFSKDELFWECLSLMASESHPTGVPAKQNMDLKDRDIQVFKQFIHGKTRPTNESTIDRLYTSWMTLCELYTLRKVTQSRDKLVALEGISNALDKVLESGLCWGLFASRIIRDLIWVAAPTHGSKTDWEPTRCAVRYFLDIPGPSSETRMDWRAPSWSWASLDVPVYYDWSAGFKSFARPYVQATVMSGAGSNNNKRELHLRGCLFDATLSRGDMEYWKGWYITISVEGGAAKELGAFFPDLKNFPTQSVQCLPLVRYGNRSSVGICVIPSRDVVGRHVRIGVCEVLDWTPRLLLSDDIEDIYLV